MMIAFGILIGTIAAVGFVVYLVIGTIVNAIEEFKQSGDIIKSIIFGWLDTFATVVDAIGGILNMLLGWTGKFHYEQGSFLAWSKGAYNNALYPGSSTQSVTPQSSSGNTTIINYNKSVSTQSAKELEELLKKINATSVS
jgi:hypothetical protein